MEFLLSLLLFVPFLAQETPSATPPKLGACVLQIDGLGEPTGVAFGPDGLLYVSESLGRRISVIDRAGKTVRDYGGGNIGDPRDVAVCNDGRIFVSDRGVGGLIVFEPNGKSSVVEFALPESTRCGAPEGLDVQGETVGAAFPLDDRILISRLNGALVRIVGERGAGAGQFNHPSDIAFAADESFYVADMFNQRVQHFSKDGRFVRAFGSPGPNPGQFSGPTGIAVCGDFVHVVDRDNSRVQIFTKQGELSSWYGIHALRPREGQGKLHYPLRVALSKDGTRAAIAEPMENRVQILGPVDPNVEELPPLPALPPSHYGGAIDADGPLLVLVEPSIPTVLMFQMMNGEPIEFGAFGTYGSHAGQLIWPNDVAIDFARRRVYVADVGAGRLLEYSFRFDPKAEIGFDPERVRFVASVELRHAETPKFMDTPGDRSVEPAGLWRDGEGGLCVADARIPVVWRFDASLQKSGAYGLGEGNYELGDGCAGPKPPDGKAACEQYVVDRAGARVIALPSCKPLEGHFKRPSAVLFTAAGATYVSDEGANALLRQTRDKPVARGPGLGPTELFRPRGLAELAGGRVLVIDWGNHRGMIFDKDDKFVRAFGSNLFIVPTIKSYQPKQPEPPIPAVEPAVIPPVAAVDGTQPWHKAKHVVSNGGSFTVFWKPTPDPIQERQTFALDVWVTQSSSPNELIWVSLEIDAAMPEHQHGMNVIPQATRADDGHFRVEGTRFQMPGRWELYFDIEQGMRTERAQVTLVLE